MQFDTLSAECTVMHLDASSAVIWSATLRMFLLCYDMPADLASDGIVKMRFDLVERHRLPIKNRVVDRAACKLDNHVDHDFGGTERNAGLAQQIVEQFIGIVVVAVMEADQTVAENPPAQVFGDEIQQGLVCV